MGEAKRRGSLQARVGQAKEKEVAVAGIISTEILPCMSCKGPSTRVVALQLMAEEEVIAPPLLFACDAHVNEVAEKLAADLASVVPGVEISGQKPFRG